MQTINDLISSEVMGGWPIFKMNLREILVKLGAINDGTYLKFHINDLKLDLYPCRLTDDGMGYGIDPEWIHEVDTQSDYINIWTEKELSKDKLDKIKKDMDDFSASIKKALDDAKAQMKDENSR